MYYFSVNDGFYDYIVLKDHRCFFFLKYFTSQMPTCEIMPTCLFNLIVHKKKRNVPKNSCDCL